MKKYGRVVEMLAAVGATLKRQGKHRVYELPNGRNFVMANTPGDARGEQNAMSDLRHALGVVGQPKQEKPQKVRREKPGRTDSDRFIGLPAERSPFAAALRESGVVEQRLRSQIGQLEAQTSQLLEQKLQSELAAQRLQLRNDVLEAEIKTLRALWVVRVLIWFRAGGIDVMNRDLVDASDCSKRGL